MSRRTLFQSDSTSLLHYEAFVTDGLGIARPLDTRRCCIPARDDMSAPDYNSLPPSKIMGHGDNR